MLLFIADLLHDDHDFVFKKQAVGSLDSFFRRYDSGEDVCHCFFLFLPNYLDRFVEKSAATRFQGGMGCKINPFRAVRITLLLKITSVPPLPVPANGSPRTLPY